eukprot:TRINITY_DN99_c0_g1_i4.p1 TRINITY_DN99_c0_g1~~TRINITY_DN99_c0_g1_i4.p1  ORF type:complete len:635 (+),score=108.96 TRINITY_DN99_c0_g1_i4:50-1954(+)
MSSLDKLGDREQFYVGEIKRLEEEIAAIQAGTSELTKDAYATIAKLQEEYSKAYRKYRSEETKDAEIDMELAKEKLNKAEANRKDTIASAVSSLKDQIHEYSEIVKQLGTQATPVAGHSEEAQAMEVEAEGPEGIQHTKRGARPHSYLTPGKTPDAKRECQQRPASPVGVPALDAAGQQSTSGPPVSRTTLTTDERLTILEDKFSKLRPTSSSSRVLTRTQMRKQIGLEGRWHRSGGLTHIKKWDGEKMPKTGKWKDLNDLNKATESVIQNALNDIINDDTLGKTFKCKWKDTSKTPTLEEMCPDLTCTVNDVTPTECNALAVLELKAYDVRPDTFKVLGQVLNYLTIILDNQCKRQKAVCLVSNVWQAVEVVCERRGDDLHFTQSDTFENDEAKRMLRGFIEMAPEDLGAAVPIQVQGKSYYLTRELGSGGSCTVFGVDTDKLVLKVFKDESKCKAEAENLHKLREVGINIPKVVGHEGKYLVLTPRAKHFSRSDDGRYFKQKHVRQLYEILKTIHDNGWVHRDVRRSNFFISEGRVLLNDWADAVRPTPTLQYYHEGAPKGYTPDFVPHDGTSTYTPRKAQDWYSFVISCFELTQVNKEKGEMPSAWTALLGMIDEPETLLGKVCCLIAEGR